LYNLDTAMREIKAVISDLGRVLVDFDNWIFLRKMEEFSPFTAGEMMDLVRSDLSILHDFDRGKITAPQFFQRAVRLFKADVDQKIFFRIYNDVFSLNPKAVAALKGLRGVLRLILLSNTDEQRFRHIKTTFPDIFFFDAYVLSYETGHIKPEPEIYRIALDAAGCEAEACLFIDDLETNIVAAETLGLRGLLMRPETDISAALRGLGLPYSSP
jgi:HAD superfamily hydrolase (TIGR01509 family)